jgi:hypothetical protein
MHPEKTAATLRNRAHDHFNLVATLKYRLYAENDMRDRNPELGGSVNKPESTCRYAAGPHILAKTNVYANERFACRAAMSCARSPK